MVRSGTGCVNAGCTAKSFVPTSRALLTRHSEELSWRSVSRLDRSHRVHRSGMAKLGTDNKNKRESGQMHHARAYTQIHVEHGERARGCIPYRSSGNQRLSPRKRSTSATAAGSVTASAASYHPYLQRFLGAMSTAVPNNRSSS